MRINISDLTVVICTIHIESANCVVQSIRNVRKDVKVIVIVDGSEYIVSEDIIHKYSEDENLKIKVMEKNEGLSAVRNYAIKNVETEYLIFFDDDVLMEDDVFTHYVESFSEGYDIVGGWILLPHNHKAMPKWLPDLYSSLIGIHTFEKKIWGANCGINARKAREANIYFDTNLGRKNRSLLSGEETSFVQEYCAKLKAKTFFDEKIKVYHNISESRYNISYLLRRAFWQGRTEVCRNNICEGLKKEFRRAYFKYSGSFIKRILKIFVGTLLFLSNVTGMVVQLCVDFKYRIAMNSNNKE